MPLLSGYVLGKSGHDCDALDDLPHVQTSAGRSAIVLALAHAGIGRGDEVLVPAYHCESMVAPVEHVGATPVYYRVDHDTLVNVADVERKITPATRAIIAAHYFGFRQRFDELRALCDARDLVLIEDCAHAFFGDFDGQAIGTLGDYAIGSPMKFFPIFDGGLLVSARRDLGAIRLRRPTLALEVKSLIREVEFSLQYGRLRQIGMPLGMALKLKDLVWRPAKRLLGSGLQKKYTPGSSEGGSALDEAWIHIGMSRFSRAVIRGARRDRICDARRRNYFRVLRGLVGVPGLRPLFDDLAEGVVPLVVPVVVDDPLALFPLMKQAGVPIWRFGEFLDPKVDASVCSDSVFLSGHVFQFPCHQDLRDDEIAWMIGKIREICERRPGAASRDRHVL